MLLCLLVLIFDVIVMLRDGSFPNGEDPLGMHRPETD